MTTMNLFFSILAFILLYSCKPESQNTEQKKNSSLAQFTYEIGQKSIVTGKSFYSTENEKALLVAISDNEKILISIPSLNQSTYQLDSSTYIVNDDGYFYCQNGTITIEKIENEQLNGNFEGRFSNNQGQTLEIKKGIFKNIVKEQKVESISKMTFSEKIIVDVNEGKIVTEKSNTEVILQENKIVFTDKNKLENSFAVEISHKQILPNSLIIKVNDSKYEEVYVDNLNKSITIFYKNGNNIIFK